MATDKRVIKTQANIKTAFMKLASDLPVNKISVSDLTAQALINRSTFYLHYNDVWAVAEDIKRDITESISSCIDEFHIADIYGSTYKMFSSLTAKLEDNPTLKRYIIYSKNSAYLTERLKNILAEKTVSAIHAKFPSIQTNKIIYQLSFAASGIIDSYIKWSRTGGVSFDELLSDVSAITEYIVKRVTT